MPASQAQTVAITLSDARSLAVCLVQPLAPKFFNWATEGWEPAFNPAAHLRLFRPMIAGNPLFGTVQTVDAGAQLLTRPGVAALILTVDKGNQPIDVVDVWTMPSPTPNPVVGNFLRF